MLDVGVALARRHSAHLAGLHAVSQTAAELAPEALQEAFHEQAMQVQLSHEWFCVRGNEQGLVVLEARTHDLLVIGQANPDTALWPQAHHLLESALIKSGHPLIALPGIVLERRRRDSDGVERRARGGPAVEDAMPLLEGARNVTLLAVDLRSGDVLSVRSAG